jgi:hypothetical protein
MDGRCKQKSTTFSTVSLDNYHCINIVIIADSLGPLWRGSLCIHVSYIIISVLFSHVLHGSVSASIINTPHWNSVVQNVTEKKSKVLI